ncbi:MAG: protein-S-isoprenylcysteine O-methyltransferase [Pseudomonadota bacterium]|nr:protein-S-isoprenylcysteine O-methyltransferase [Pseudomonadota bacterium]
MLGLLLYMTIRFVFQRRVGGTPVKATRVTLLDRTLVFLVVLGQIVVPLFYIFGTWLNFASYEASRALPIAGALLWLAGVWLFWRSHTDLGNNWSVTLQVRSTHQLVTHGVYRTVRHPMYAAFLLLAAAQVLLLPNWIAGGSALAAVGLMCVIRVPREESMMCEFFGEDYRQYMRNTGSVVPRLRPSRPA